MYKGTVLLMVILTNAEESIYLVQLIHTVVEGLKNMFDQLCIDGELTSFGTTKQTDLSEKKSLLKFPKAMLNVLVYHLASGCPSLAEIQS